MDNIDTTFYEKREKLKKLCRSDFANYLRKLLLKDKCELCSSEDRLELHHVRSFTNMLDEVIEKVGIDNVELIREIMLGKQLKCESITLCKNCHTELHNEKGGFRNSITNKYLNINPHIRNKIKINDSNRQLKVKYINLYKREKEMVDIKNYITKNINKELTTKIIKDEIFNKIYIRKYNSFFESVYKLNEYLMRNNIKYKLISKINKNNISWIIIKI